MSVRNLEALFSPGSVALVGASEQPGSLGTVLLRNLMAGGFCGPVLPVNPKYSTLQGRKVWRDVEELPEPPDLAVICTPPATIPGIIATLGNKGTRAAVVISAGVAQQAMLDAARPHLVRVLGPNCLGLLVPGIGLNASFAHTGALRGRLAFVSQSGAMCTAVLDWARSGGIGFSHFVSLGNSADVDFGDALDYLGADADTQAILLYIEAIDEARKFMSAARAAARNKPVLAIKAGRVAEGARAAASHTGALAGADEVYDAALRRAGILRVFSTEELFEAVETLGRARPIKGERLAILSNGGGPGVMATDSFVSGGGVLATLAEETVRALDAALPATWSRANPVDIIGDADAGRYAAALGALRRDPGVDAVLVLHAPQAIVSSEEAARAVIEESNREPGRIVTCWLGRDAAGPARRLFASAGIPTYETPEEAGRAFLHMVRYRRNQEALMATPESAPSEFAPDTAAARRVIEEALAEGRALLTEPEAKQVLAAYAIPVVETRVAATPEEAARLAGQIGFPVAAKIVSPDVSHKSDVGGVALDLTTPAEVAAAARAMAERLERHVPGARLSGFAVQGMARRPGARELIVGVASDPTFGPVILFGHGGTAVEVIGDRAVALPPMDMTLARDLVARTRVSRLLAGYRDRPPADLAEICRTLLKVSQLVVDVPEVVELDVNPLLADERGVVALDARLRVAATASRGAQRLAIRPYPRELEEWVTLRSGRRLLVRPIRPEDEPAHHAFHAALAPDDIRFRFFGMVRRFPHSQMARFTQIDYDREMAFIATAPDASGRPETLGVVRVVADPDNVRAEFAVIVRSDTKGQGLGHALLEKMVRYCRARGTGEIVGQVMASNQAMLDLARELGFCAERAAAGDALTVRLSLAAA